ncbi:CHD3-type chromatin-remodeling factor [Seminavis robusta]|uniref:CHD3-type chromatin-remodeling factor n=1 Tax=Seminavis robusta TaxID=568900 RepID=A0A9N8HS64_9STRA|nr:CHD3-type chromatin-remodeling factor [Seminavis robusta]|eukprot:Sro1483_g276410.1 CHD3-type chromatin-remodeling factor (715) ;mRNA; f:14805-17128
MSPPTRTEFLRSRFYRCALAFDKRNDERLKNIREFLEKADQKNKRSPRPVSKKKYTSTWKIPDGDDRAYKVRNSKEDQGILSVNKEEADWVYDESKDEYALSLGGITVMKIPSSIHLRLKSFQRDAVKWIATAGPTGGILADDMGMGKTFMSIAAIGARMRVQRIRMVLVVAPVSVLGGWTEECNKFLSKFVKKVRIVKVHGGEQKKRQKAVRNAWKKSSYDQPHVIISSWGLVASARTMKTFLPPSGHSWDYVILDEAHEVKNHKSNRSKCCRRICHKPGTSRLLLTGTPFQNNTDELWSIVHMATAGHVLGKLKEFNLKWGKPIREARCRNASSMARKKGSKANEELQGTLKPYVLRRLKIDFLSDELPPKREICVWVKPSHQQKQMYKEEMAGYLAKDICRWGALHAFQVMTKFRSLCGHPLLLLKGDADIRSALDQTDLKSLLKGSSKLELVLHMIKGFRADGHKTLLFSQRTGTLDIIQRALMLQDNNMSIFRLDGSFTERCRKDTVDYFQQGMSDVLLLSTGAGGVGLTLTRASRVILFDPSWNPSEDAQVVDRAYRIGQTKEVFVYRLFMAGSVEEKMYERQVDKSGIEKTIFTEGSMDEMRFFDRHEMCKVFDILPDGNCELLKRFKTEGVAQVTDAHRHDLVRAHSSVVGISNHSTIYRQKRKSAFADAPSISAKRLKQTTETAEADGTEATPAVVSDIEGSPTE